MGFNGLIKFMNEYLQKNNVKLDHGTDHAKLMKDILFRHHYTLVLVDRIRDNLEFTQMNPNYEGKFIPLKFKVAFFNKENECCNIQEISLDAKELNSIPLEIDEFEYFIVDPDMKCHALFDIDDSEYTEKIMTAWNELENPHKISAYKTIYFKRTFNNKGTELDGFVQLWKKICHESTTGELIKYSIMTRNLNYKLNYRNESGFSNHSKDCFDIVLKRLIETKEMDFLIPLLELKSNNDPESALEIAHILTKQ